MFPETTTMTYTPWNYQPLCPLPSKIRSCLDLAFQGEIISFMGGYNPCVLKKTPSKKPKKNGTPKQKQQ